MVKTMVSCRFSLKPIHWFFHDNHIYRWFPIATFDYQRVYKKTGKDQARYFQDIDDVFFPNDFQMSNSSIFLEVALGVHSFFWILVQTIRLIRYGQATKPIFKTCLFWWMNVSVGEAGAGWIYEHGGHGCLYDIFIQGMDQHHSKPIWIALWLWLTVRHGIDGP